MGARAVRRKVVDVFWITTLLLMALALVFIALPFYIIFLWICALAG